MLAKKQLPAPELCPIDIYDLMCGCWSHQTEERPTARVILCRIVRVSQSGMFLICVNQSSMFLIHVRVVYFSSVSVRVVGFSSMSEWCVSHPCHSGMFLINVKVVCFSSV